MIVFIKDVLLALLFTIGCNSPETSVSSVSKKNDTIYDDSHIATTPLPLAGCYSWAIKRDTATLQLDVDGNKVTGNLKYKWYEKDGNTGTLKGDYKR